MSFLLRTLGAIIICSVLVIAAVGRHHRPAEAVDSITLTPVLSGLARPTFLTGAGDGTNRIFITQQTGQVLVWNGIDPPTTYLDIDALSACCGEQGLLSIAFPPDFETDPNRYFYINYTDNNGDAVIARYAQNSPPNQNTANPLSATVLLTIPHPGETNHNGGQLQFGPDGMLYFGMGDGGGAGDTSNNAQNVNTLLGKIIRLDPKLPAPYIPSSNPYYGATPGRDEIWAIGVRNPWRFSFDRSNGDFWLADVGQDMWEEVDLTPSGSPGGLNYGWHTMEGTHCYNPSTGCNQTGLVLPQIEYQHLNGNCSITGGYRYRGTAYPDFAGHYVYGDYCSGRIWSALPGGGGTWVSSQLLDTTYSISSFGEDDTGEIYVLHRGTGSDGAVFRINASLMADADGDGCSAAEEQGPDPAFGGQRNPALQWDFYDVNSSKKVDSTDIALVRAHFTGPNPTPPGDEIYDRRNGAQVWAPGPPDGKINATDIALVRAEFNHSCQGFP